MCRESRRRGPGRDRSRARYWTVPPLPNISVTSALSDAVGRLAALQHPHEFGPEHQQRRRQASHCRRPEMRECDPAIGIGDIGGGIEDAGCIARRDRDRHEVGLADEARHEPVGRAVIDVGRACPTADMAPSRITQMRSASIIASSRSCVTWTKVTPTERCRRLSSACSTFFSLTSSAESGSSSNSSLGYETMERASATRCCSPPDSWRG